MSSELIYRLEVVRLQADGLGSPGFIVAGLVGSSNCYETRTGRRARDWSIIAVGPHYQVVRTICHIAGDCEGGMVKYPGGRSCKPETLIRAYRAAEANAADGFVEASRRGLAITLRRVFSAEAQANGQGYNYAALIKAGREPRVQTRYGQQEAIFDFDKAKPEDVALWRSHLDHKEPWNNGTVFGSRD